IALFVAQRHGTARLGAAFGPIMIAWFVLLAVLGIGHLAQNPAILGALSPHHAVRFFFDNGWQGFRVLGGVMLAVTGGKALYADMGPFGRRPLRLGWVAVVLPPPALHYFRPGAVVPPPPPPVAPPP